jgi:putative ABC transport system permease protein
MIKSVGRLLGVDPGFNPDRVLTLNVSFVGAAYAQDDQVVAKTDRMLEKLRELPGVDAVATASQIPLGGNGDCWGFHIQGRPGATPADDACPERYGVTPDYFRVMQIPLKSGRLFSDGDRVNSEAVVIIGERTARTLWPTGDAIGQHVRIGDPANGPWRTIVGVVGDVRHAELAAPPTLQMYTPQSQVTDSYLTVVIRGGADPSRLASEARHAIWSVAKDVPVYNISPLADLVAQSVGPRRFMMVLLELFAAVALLMTAVGLYGVISYSVVERTREIGIRAALGASRVDIVRLVMGGGLAIVGAGMAIGVVAAAAATRYLQGSLYAVSPTDPATFMGVVCVLFAVAALAQAVPVARAMRVDPAVALRQD